MSTQVLEIEAGSARAPFRVRDDVTSVLVVVTENGRPVRLLSVPRPADGTLMPEAIDLGPPHADHRPPDAPAAVRKGGRPALVSVVIPTHERPEDLARCLGVLAPLRAAGHEVIVVDNAPRTDRTAAVVARYGVRYVVEPVAGANRARNAGLAHAGHEIVAFVDDDVVVSATWVAAIA